MRGPAVAESVAGRHARGMDEVIPIQTARDQRLRGEGHRLERATATGQLERIRQGAYVEREQADAAPPLELHRARVLATRHAATREPTFSHESAAAVHGIPLIGDWPEWTRTTVATRASSSGAVRRSLRSLAREDCCTLSDGTRATTPTRTAIDLAASRSLLAGIVAISHVRQHGVRLDDFEAAFGRLGRFPGLRRARIALARSTAGSESVLETLIVVRCQDYGFVPPEQQRRVVGVDGIEYRVDFAWQEGRILAEGDGRDNYENPEYLAGRSPAEALWAEKRREDALRPGRAFVRIGWVDAWRGEGLARRLLAVGVPRPDRRLVSLTF